MKIKKLILFIIFGIIILFIPTILTGEMTSANFIGAFLVADYILRYISCLLATVIVIKGINDYITT